MAEISTSSYSEMDKLNRIAFADRILKMLKNIKNPYVININGDWGSGKSFLLNLLKEKMDNKCIYINAFENDYYDDPFSSIAAEISLFIKNQNPKDQVAQKVLDEASKLGRILARQSLPLLINVGMNRLFGQKRAEKMIELVKTALSDYCTSFIEKNEERKMGMKQLRNSLERYIENTESKQLVILIDELDRCKPDYTLEMLELLKHLFEIKGIVFILATASQRLFRLIENNMGVDDPELYTRKFFNVTIDLPIQSLEDFIEYHLGRPRLMSVDDTSALFEITTEIVKICINERLNLRDIIHCIDTFQIHLLLLELEYPQEVLPFLFFLIIQNELHLNGARAFWKAINDKISINHDQRNREEAYNSFKYLYVIFLLCRSRNEKDFLDKMGMRPGSINVHKFLARLCSMNIGGKAKNGFEIALGGLGKCIEGII